MSEAPDLTKAANALVGGLQSLVGEDQSFPGELMLSDGYPDNDDGNAHRFLQRHGSRVRYCAPWKNAPWLLYEHGQWVRDESHAVQELCKDVPKALYNLAAETDDEDERDRVLRAAKNAGEQPRIVRALQSAASSPLASMRVEEFDQHPLYVNCLNGVFDLKTGVLKKHDQELYLTHQIPRKYDHAAQCPKWQAFLLRIMGGNVDMVSYLQRVLGYGLVGDNRHQAFFLFWGGGANGKTTMVNTVCEVLGMKQGAGYASHADPSTFMEERYETRKPRPDLARLHAVRFVVAVEPRDDCKLDPGIIKRVTGGEPIVCRDLYASDFQYTPQFKVYLCSNNKPGLNGADYAMIRRLRFIPFSVTIPKEERVENYHLQLLEEADGIFAWLIQGALDSLKGLNDPKIVVDATEEYRLEMDDIQPFINDACDVAPAPQVSLNGGETGIPVREPMKILYKVYAAWCEYGGLRPMSRRKFADRLRQKGFRSANGTDNNVEFHGIKVSSAGMTFLDIDYVTRRSKDTMGYPQM